MPDLLRNKLAALATTLSERIEKEWGELSPSSVATLLTLGNRGATSTTELARILGLSQPATTRLVEKLASDGFINRGNKSGREIALELTGAGKRLAAKAQKRRLRISEILLRGLSSTEQSKLESLVDKMLEGLATTRLDARHVCRFCDHAPCTGPDCPVGRSIPNDAH